MREAERVADVAWQTVAELMARIQLDPARDWSLEVLARASGYERHHLAHVFTEVCGESPHQYVKRLRLEWAAYLLRHADHPTVADVAGRLGYGSGEAFCRAFRQHFGATPTAFREQPYRLGAAEPLPVPRAVRGVDWPRGLVPDPEIVEVGPLSGWTFRIPSFAPQDVLLGMGHLLQHCPPTDSWQLGGVSQPWGWTTESAEREFRCLRVVDANAGAPPPPLLPWRLDLGWFARFEFDGDGTDAAAACLWIMAEWIPRAGLRIAYGPLFSLTHATYGPQGGRLRIHAPVVVGRPPAGLECVRDDPALG